MPGGPVLLTPRRRERNVARIHAHLRIQDDDALDQIAQLAYVSRPMILREHVVSLRRQLLGLAPVRRGEFAQEMVGKQGDIFAPLA
jgi:predicted transcriptional regulator